MSPRINLSRIKWMTHLKPHIEFIPARATSCKQDFQRCLAMSPPIWTVLCIWQAHITRQGNRSSGAADAWGRRRIRHLPSSASHEIAHHSWPSSCSSQQYFEGFQPQPSHSNYVDHCPANAYLPCKRSILHHWVKVVTSPMPVSLLPLATIST